MKQRIIHPLIVLCALLCAAAVAAQPLAPVQQAPSKEWAAAIQLVDRMASEELARDGVGSVTLGLVSGPKLVWSKSYGYADTEAKRPATRDSVYRIGSITKQFTALMLLMLVEQGKLRLADPVEKYVPELKAITPLFPEMPRPTLVELASMTSGLAREPSGPPDHSIGPVSGWQAKVFASLPLTSYAHEPDTRYLYSNIGYATLGIALARAAGEPFTDYVERRIVAPLGMTRTAFELSRPMREHVAKGYELADGKADAGASVREYEGRGYRVPNGALFSTVDDLAKFVSWELGEGPSGILDRKTQDENYSRLNFASGDLTFGYGVGFQAARRGTLVALGHGGSTAGFRTSALFDRRSKTGVIVLGSVAGGKLNVGALALRALQEIAAVEADRGAQPTATRQ